MNTMSQEAGAEADAEGGPMWGRFFESLGHEDTESMLSGSNIPGTFEQSHDGNSCFARYNELLVSLCTTSHVGRVVEFRLQVEKFD